MYEHGTLKLHTAADGMVWCADGTSVACASAKPAEVFVRDWHPPCPCRVRVLGARQNAALLAGLWQQKRKCLLSFEVAKPGVSPNLRDPVETLYAMRQCRFAPSQGGWHGYTAADHAQYMLMMQRSRYALQQHPVWPAVNFIPRLDWNAVLEILCAITDPRWYVDPGAPERMSRYFAYLGLVPRHARAQGSPVWAATYRVLTDCWSGDPPQDPSRPEEFLWRVRDAAGGGWRGTLRASQKFAIFLRRIWLQAIYRGTRYSGGDTLFLPDMFFKTPEEVTAFRRHMQQVGDGAV
jgi:hypothetical protein